MVLDKNIVKAGDRVRYLPESDWYKGAKYAFSFGTVVEYNGSVRDNDGINVRWDCYNYAPKDAHNVPENAITFSKEHYVNKFIKML